VQHSLGVLQDQDGVSASREVRASEESTEQVKALASVLLGHDPAAAFSVPGHGARLPAKDGNPSTAQVRAHGEPNMAADFEPPFWAPGLTRRAFERIPGIVREPWIPSWLDEEEKAERRLEEAVKWRPEYIPEPWIGPLAEDDERAKIWDEHERVLAAQAAAPCPSWVTDWLREAGKPEAEVPTTVGECMPLVGKILPGQRIIFKPPPWAEGCTKRMFEQIPHPWGTPEPWIPSWLDEEEQAERRLESAEKWRPEYIPEPWLGAIWEDEERVKVMEDHKRVLEAQRAAPPPEWVLDWLKEAGKPLPATVGEIMDTPAPVPEPWKPSWIEDDDEDEPKPEPAPAPAPAPDPAPEPFTPSWAKDEPAPAPAPVTAASADGSSLLGALKASVKEGDEIEFKVSGLVKTGNKVEITLDGPNGVTLTAEGELS